MLRTFDTSLIEDTIYLFIVCKLNAGNDTSNSLGCPAGSSLSGSCGLVENSDPMKKMF